MLPTFLSAARCGENFHGLGVHNIKAFDSYSCFVFCLMEEGEEKERKRTRETDGGGEFPEARLTLLVMQQVAVLGAIKGLFKGQSLKFFCT
jgi:hypothetical protein